MTLTNEAAYLYVYAKKLVSINKRLKKLSKKAQKHAERHNRAQDQAERDKHRIRHGKVKRSIEELLKEHHELLKKIKHHYSAFAHVLQNEHKI